MEIDEEILFKRGVRMLITASDGTGKSTTAIFIAREALKRGYVDQLLFIDIDSKSINQEEDYSKLAEIEGWVYKTMDAELSPQEKRLEVAKCKELLDKQHTVVVIDNWSRLTADEDRTNSAKEALEDLNSILKHKNATTLLIGHLGKDVTKGLRGSSDVRSVFGVELRLTNPIGRIKDIMLTVTKDNGFDGETSLRGSSYLVQMLDTSDTKINSKDIKLKFIPTDESSIITEGSLKMYKDLMAQVLYNQTLYELGKRYGANNYILFSTFKKIFGNSGTKIVLKDENNKIKALTYDAHEYLNGPFLINMLPALRVLVSDYVTLNRGVFKDTNKQFKNIKVIKLLDRDTFETNIKELNAQATSTTYSIHTLPDKEMLNTIVETEDLVEEIPTYTKIAESLSGLLIDFKDGLSTTEIRKELTKNITKYSFSARDVATYLKDALLYGIETNLFTLVKDGKTSIYRRVNNER